jgi:hypothetical protein
MLDKAKRDDLIRRSVFALTSLKSMRADLEHKENKGKMDYDVISILNTATGIFEEMQEQWLFSIGLPRRISDETVDDVIDSVSHIIRERAEKYGKL